jgi:hypothetical protein
MISLIRLISLCFICVAGFSSAAVPADEINKYESIFTATLYEGANGRYFGIDNIIKGVATPVNTALLNKINNFDRLDVGQRVIVLGFNERINDLIIAVINKNGFFDIKFMNGESHKFSLEQLRVMLSK